MFEYTAKPEVKLWMDNLPSRRFISCLNPAQPIRLTAFDTYSEAHLHTLAEVNQVRTIGNLAAYLTFVEDDEIQKAILELEGIGRVVIEGESAAFFIKAINPTVKSFLKAFFTRLGYENPSETMRILHENNGSLVLLNDIGHYANEEQIDEYAKSIKKEGEEPDLDTMGTEGWDCD